MTLLSISRFQLQENLLNLLKTQPKYSKHV